MTAMTWYDKAVTAARDNDFVQWEALANELAAKFWMAKGKHDFAWIYLREAHALYDKWGAIAKVRALETNYGQLMAQASDIGLADVCQDSCRIF